MMIVLKCYQPISAVRPLLRHMVSLRYLLATVSIFALLQGSPYVGAVQVQESSADSAKEGLVDEWAEIRARVLPVAFILHENEWKVNLERLLVQLLDDSVFPDNPLQVDLEQRTKLKRVFQSRQQEVESLGYDLKAAAGKMAKRGRIAMRELDTYLPGLDVYSEHAKTVKQLKAVLTPAQIRNWREMALLHVHVEMRSFYEFANRMAWSLGENTNRFDTDAIRRAGALEDFRLSIESNAQLARSFDRIVSVLPPSEREKLDRYMKVDGWK